ncbi:MAG TPA: hypothetical protein VID94_15470 [Acidimicrobiales bacterium]
MSDPGGSGWAVALQASDRVAFKRCRRAWDFGSPARRNLVPRRPVPTAGLGTAVHEALAVYYFPGMWEWPREIVEPLAREAFLGALGDHVPAEDIETGLDLLDRYFAWAPGVDRFTPVRVAAEFEVDVPDPVEADISLRSVAGRPVRFRGRVELLVVDPADAYWIVTHHLRDTTFTEPDLLVLDEAAVTACWGWERCFVGMRIAGTVANELCPAASSGAPPPTDRPDRHTTTHRRMYAQAAGRPTEEVDVVGDGPFRRTRIPRPRAAFAEMGRQLAREVQEMTDPAMDPYPHPTEDGCATCPYRPPCLALSAGADPSRLLATDFQARAPERAEGRLGGGSWSMNRGAAPPRFRGDPDP